MFLSHGDIQLTKYRSTKAVLDKVDAALKSLKTRHEEVDSSLVLNLVSEFDTEDNSMCSRFSPQVYDVLLRTILQAEYSREGERGLYLLAVSCNISAGALALLIE